MTVSRRARALAAVALLGAAALPLYRGGADLPALAPLGRACAAAAELVLDLAGVAVERDGAVLRRSPAFAVEVAPHCTAWLHVLLFAAGLSALRPRRFVRKLLTGIAILSATNVLRIAAVYAAGAFAPRAFDLAHRVLGEAVLVVAVLLLWRAAARATAADSAAGDGGRPGGSASSGWERSDPRDGRRRGGLEPRAAGAVP